MLRLLLTVLIYVALVLPLRAGSYNEFNRGLWAFNHGEYSTAIAYFDKALAPGDLPDNLKVVAHIDSGASYAQTTDYAAAVDQYSAAIALDPSNTQVYAARASAYQYLGKTDSALADMDAAVARAPVSDSLLFLRGRFKWADGKFSAAADDIAQAHQIAEQKPYYVLWLEITRRRAGIADMDTFEENVSSLDIRGWPKPLLRLFEDRDTADEVRNDANDGSDIKIQKNQICEANFYVGEYYILQSNEETARPLIASAAAMCPDDFIEKAAAQAELNRLGEGGKP